MSPDQGIRWLAEPLIFGIDHVEVGSRGLMAEWSRPSVPRAASPTTSQWLPVPQCTCGATPTDYLRDVLGAELLCTRSVHGSRGHRWCVWFTAEQTAAIRAHPRTTRAAAD